MASGLACARTQRVNPAGDNGFRLPRSARPPALLRDECASVPGPMFSVKVTMKFKLVH